MRKALHSDKQRRGHQAQSLGSIDVWQPVDQGCWRRTQTSISLGFDIQAHADHHITARAAAGRFNQNTAQLAALDPQIVGPLQTHLRMQTFRQAQTHSQRQPRPIFDRERQAERKRQRITALADPLAAQSATPCTLRFGHQQDGIGLTGPCPAHQLGVAGVKLSKYFYAEIRQSGVQRFPNGFAGPRYGVLQRNGHEPRQRLALGAGFWGFRADFLAWLGILGVAGLLLGASSVLRQLALPHQQGYSALSLGV